MCSHGQISLEQINAKYKRSLPARCLRHFHILRCIANLKEEARLDSISQFDQRIFYMKIGIDISSGITAVLNTVW